MTSVTGMSPPRDTVVTTSLGKTSSLKSNTDLRQMWNAILDRQITELNCRLQEDSYGIIRAAASLLPGCATFGELQLLRSLSKHYGISITEAEYSVFIFFNYFYILIRRKMDAGQNYPSLMEVLDNCPAEIFRNVSALLNAITLPMTSCTVERLF